jgi:hypothetical protein
LLNNNHYNLEEGGGVDVHRARDDAHKDDATSNHPPEDNNNENKNIYNKVAVVNILIHQI